MFKIINAEGREIGKTEAPYYIKIAENGSFVPCEERDAQGVTHSGRTFRLFGRSGLSSDYEAVILAEAGQIDNTTAAEHAAQFGEWAYPVAYKIGAIRRYEGRLYQCVQAHTSQIDWTPPAAASLWAEIADPAEEWPKWAQPIGAHDAYNAGDKVSHNSKKWKSTCDGNVWEPGVYGWTEETT